MVFEIKPEQRRLKGVQSKDGLGENDCLMRSSALPIHPPNGIEFNICPCPWWWNRYMFAKPLSYSAFFALGPRARTVGSHARIFGTTVG